MGRKPESWPSDPVHPDEEREAQRRGFGPRRLAEFRAGRWCAHRALAPLGLGESPIPIAMSREPVWPAGVVGSITHCLGYCAAAVAPSAQLRGIGIDAELPSEVSFGLAEQICGRAELARLSEMPCDATLALSLTFSAKESVFKALFPRERVFLEFPDVELLFDYAEGTFTITGPVMMLVGDVARRVRGRFAFGTQRVLTLATVAAEA